MKKKNLRKIATTVLTAALAVVFTFTSCSKPVTDENGFSLDGKSAVEIAKKEKKNILLVATMKGDDLFSSDLIDFVLKDSRFNEEIGSKYTVLLTDFSEASYGATVYNDDSTKEEKKIAEENAERMHQNTLLASRLNLQLTPAIYIMSKDMYYITQLDFTTDQITNFDSFKELLEKQQPIVDDFNSRIEKIEKGSKTEKLAAIDQLYESTESAYIPFIKNLIEEYIKLDKKDETGLLSKYLLAKADIESSNYFIAGDVGNAVKIYVNTAKDMRLKPEDRQNCYYLSAYILVISGSQDLDSVVGYLKSAIDAYPEGPNTPSIEMALEEVEAIRTSMAQQPVTAE